MSKDFEALELLREDLEVAHVERPFIPVDDFYANDKRVQVIAERHAITLESQRGAVEFKDEYGVLSGMHRWYRLGEHVVDVALPLLDEEFFKLYASYLRMEASPGEVSSLGKEIDFDERIVGPSPAGITYHPMS